MIERKPPTHLLQINVPLNLEANPAVESYVIQDAMHEALQLVVRIARVGTLGLLCDDPEVVFRPVDVE